MDLNSSSFRGLSSDQMAVLSITCSIVLMPERTDRDALDALQEAEGPDDGALFGTQGVELGFGALGQAHEAAAAHGLHDPDRNAALVEQGHLLVGVLQAPVHVVELYLAELHVLAVGIQEALQHGQRAVSMRSPDA